MNVSIVVPILNEEETVEPLYRKIVEVMDATDHRYEILFIDDGSTDRTPEILQRLAGESDTLRVVRFRRNFGQTAALAAGFDRARGEVVVTLDADLQNDPTDIPRLLEEMTDEVDVVSGWRKDRKDKFLSRRLPSMMANALISRITGVRLHDYGCTLKAYRREVLEHVRLYGEMHRFIPALASWAGGNVREVVVKHHPRRFGKSKYGISRTFRVVLDLTTVKFLLRYSTGPIQIFGKIGGYFGAAGLLLLGVMVAGNVSANLFGTKFAATLVKRPFWPITAFMLIFFGLQFVSMGLLAEIMTRTYHESQNKPIYVVREEFGDGPLPLPSD